MKFNRLAIIIPTVAALLVSLASCRGFLPEDQELMGLNWSISMESLSDPAQVVNLHKDKFVCEQVSRGVFKYSCDDATVLLEWTSERNSMEVTPTVTNCKDGWVVTSVIGPLVNIDRKIEDYHLIVPNGYGEMFTRTPDDSPEFQKPNATKAMYWKKSGGRNAYFEIGDKEAVPTTPSRKMTMQWCAFAGAADGLYLASHDPGFTYKGYSIRYYPAEDIYRFGIRCHHIIRPGETWTFPSTIVRQYKGDWHAAADMYRSWYESVKTRAPHPAWAKKTTGWLLAILKQQNDEIIWPYGDVATSLADVAEARGLDMVGLFGWTVGGHDRFYPDYDVCPRMGGEETLRQSLKTLRERGLHSIIYVNGQLIDQNGTQFWPDTGRFITLTKKDGTLGYETWHKYSDAPARTHGLACHSCDVWRQRMLRLAMRAEELGADGIIFDQLGNRIPMMCYNADHGHDVPAIVYEQDRQSNLDYVRESMARINPEFIVITEGTQDAEMSAIDIYHGCTYGVYLPKLGEAASLVDSDSLRFHPFPEMLKYTLPDIECTVRHPCPVSPRRLLNYGTAYGFKHEIESRYYADRRYLLEDRIPEVEDYGNVISKPNLTLVREEDPAAMRVYSKQVLDLRKKYTEALLEGTFRDNLGISLKSDGHVLAKLFTAVDGSYKAVVLWNTSVKAADTYELRLDGRRPVYIDSPEGEVTETVLGPESIHVAIFK